MPPLATHLPAPVSTRRYVVFELVHLETLKSLQNARKKKTKTVKKTLNPVWEEPVTSWGDIEEDLSLLALKAEAWDGDRLSSDPLGSCVVPLAHVLGEGIDDWYPLKGMKGLKEGRASGDLRISVAAFPSA